MQITVVGLGYVGSVAAVHWAQQGHTVVGVDTNKERAASVNAGKAPVNEVGLDAAVRQARASGNLIGTDDLERAVRSGSVTAICVNTPTSKTGMVDITNVLTVAEEIGLCLREYAGIMQRVGGEHIVIVHSTVPPGTVRKRIVPLIEELSGRRHGNGWRCIMVPEFLRQGAALQDAADPSLQVIGTSNGKPCDFPVFCHVCDMNPKACPACGIVPSLFPAHVRYMRWDEAELLKYACNAWHATKITFANEIGRWAQDADIDGRVVMDALRSDTRLNTSGAYLNPGFAYGGSCLPKDLRYLSENGDLATPLLESLATSNRVHVQWIAERIVATGLKTFYLDGRGYKAGSTDLRETAADTLRDVLLDKGLTACEQPTTADLIVHLHDAAYPALRAGQIELDLLDLYVVDADDERDIGFHTIIGGNFHGAMPSGKVISNG